jgi:hypothetical protein
LPLPEAEVPPGLPFVPPATGWASGPVEGEEQATTNTAAGAAKDQKREGSVSIELPPRIDSDKSRQ